MPIRRFNYTQRKRIEQEHVTVHLKEAPEGHAATFDAELDLAELELPSNAKVLVEAYRGRAVARYEWGIVGNLRPPSDRFLTELPSNPQFRVKVVAPDESGTLLAMANRIKPQREEHHGSFVWMELSDDLGKEVWRLDFGDGNPTLKLNRAIDGIGNAAQRDKAFQALVMPEVLRALLVEAIILGGAELDDDAGEWADVMGFVRSFWDDPLPPISEDVSDHRQELRTWIDDAVKAFTQGHFEVSNLYTSSLEQR